MVKFRALHLRITVSNYSWLTPRLWIFGCPPIDLALRVTPGNLLNMGYRASTIVSFHIGLYALPAYPRHSRPSHHTLRAWLGTIWLLVKREWALPS